MRFKAKGLFAAILSLLVLWSLCKVYLSGPSRKKSRHTRPPKPGWMKPNYYKKGDNVDILVNKVESDRFSVPYGYYDLPFVCPPSEGKKPLHLSLNEVINGDRKWESDYKLRFGIDVECERLCDRKTQPEALKKADALIRQGYNAHWLIDRDMPAATTFIKARNGKKFYSEGFPIGTVDTKSGKTYLHNHVMLVVRYHTADINKHTIVGFEVYPKSTIDYHCPGGSKDYKHYEINTDEKDTTFIPFTYSVYWREEFHNDWSHRWSFFMTGDKPDASNFSKSFNWFYLINSMIVLSLMSLIVAVIVAKVRDDGTTRSLASSWKSYPSQFLLILNLATAIGVQFLFALLGALSISCSLSKFHDIISGVISIALVCFVLSAYASSVLGTLLAPGPQATLGVSVISGCTLPGVTLGAVMLLNSIIWAKDSTDALPFRTVVIIAACYFVVCGPISILGGLTARKLRATAHKTTAEKQFPLQFLTAMHYEKQEANQTHKNKALPEFLSNPVILAIICGFPPFILIWFQGLTVYRSSWLKTATFHSLYGFILFNIVSLCVAVIEVSMVVCCLLILYGESGDSDGSDQLLHGDFVSFDQKLRGFFKGRSSATDLKRLLRNLVRDLAARMTMASSGWRWKCFLAGSSVAWYLEAYALYYSMFVLRLRDFSSILLFTCYTALFNFMCWCAFGSLGYLSCLWLLSYVSRICKSR
ncbi:LAME_0F11452g1_1 [Lachancea meyersii CBS 8951]|uniref:Transmembrane 9 superfamily member n=1 Tax=Lachancea meyersii CBS 8951 TaxID=1266667 RepID=A0A1G4JW95_9SACH|nr:LAME_0F11452g1_1 [Lachancea meyersii CBS 8951]